MAYFRSVLAVLGLLSFTLMAQPLDYYFANDSRFKHNIPTPHQVLGVHIGERHIRHDQLITYFQQLANASSRVQLTNIGHSYEHRPHIIATISSAENLAQLDDILARRQNSTKQKSSDPAVIWLGYSIHGNEISGSNAAALVAYYLSAGTSTEVTQLLKDLVIVIEPSMNPDGMDRFVTWANSNRYQSLNADVNHREHHLQWPSSRLNHYMFDLNRDWLALTQIESQNRMAWFHRYQPNVLADFHEMDHNGSYFFQPGIPSRNNPLTPAANIELTQLLASFHAKALDQHQHLYYSEESFDDFFYGKGSTYPDINGSIGILFEQASARGYAQNTINGQLTLAYSIKNHLLTSLSTLKGAWQHKAKLHRYRQQFYQQVNDLADQAGFAGYLITVPNDAQRLQLFLTLLHQHKISAYPLTKRYQDEGVSYPAQQSYFVPLEQRQYRLIKTLFARVSEFNDSSFYDVSGWTMPLAFNMQYSEVETSRGLSVSANPWQPESGKLTSTDAPQALTNNAYAYVFSWDNFFAPRLLNQLLQQGIKARVATQPFSAQINDNSVAFNAGAIVIPSAIQTINNWQDLLISQQQHTGVNIYAVNSGTNAGIDIGSPSMKVIEPIKVMIIGGHGVIENEVGDMLYYLDQQMGIAVSVVDHYRLNSINFNDYSHIIMVDGEYQNLPTGSAQQLRTFVEQGGTLYGQKGALRYLIEHRLLDAQLISRVDLQRAFNTQGLQYQDFASFYANQQITGSIFNADIDTSHPLVFGIHSNRLAVFKNSNDMLKLPSQAFTTVGRYTLAPLLSGYASEELVNQLAGNAAIIAHTTGQGRVIASDNNLVFRGHWLATAKIVTNSLFFSKAFDTMVPN